MTPQDTNKSTASTAGAPPKRPKPKPKPKPRVADQAPPTTPIVLMLTGPTMMGKTFFLQRVLVMRFNVVTEQTDRIYAVARKHSGIPAESTIVRNPEHLRDGSIDRDIVKRFWKFYKRRVKRTFTSAAEYNMPAVLEGHSLRLPDEATRVLKVARAALGPDVRVLRLIVERPYDEWVENLIRRAESKSPERGAEVKDAISRRDARFRARYAELTAAVPAVEGVEDRHVKTEDELVEIAQELGLVRHRWYQGFTIGPISVKRAITNAHEKADPVTDEDCIGKDVLDLCCATGAVGMLLKLRGANRVVGIEKMKERYLKCEELRKVLAGQAQVDMTNVRFYSGDMFRVMPTLDPFDTVVAMGILHYFEDYASFLQTMASKARQAMYIEVLRPDLVENFGESIAGAPSATGLVPYYRRNDGVPKWAADEDTLKKLFADALPDFELVAQLPSQGLGKSGPDTAREIWRVVRRSGDVLPAAVPTDGKASNGVAA